MNRIKPILFPIILPCLLGLMHFLPGQNLINESGYYSFLTDSKAIEEGTADKHLSIRKSFFWMGYSSQLNDLQSTFLGDRIFRNSKLKIYPSLVTYSTVDGGHLNSTGGTVDLAPTMTLMANYKLPPMGKYSILVWSRFEKHSLLGSNAFPDTLKYLLSAQKEIGYQKNQNDDSTWVEYDVGEGGLSLMYPKGSFSLIKSNPIWGPGYSGQIVFSNKSPSFTYFQFQHQLTKKWLFTYIHGSLNSTFRDTLQSDLYEGRGFPLINKFVAAHRFDYFPRKNIRLGLGESVVYGNRGMEPAYLLPMVLFWSLQHDLGDSDNLQMFFDFDIIRKDKGRFYGSFFIDEWDFMSTFKKNDERRLWWAYQFGITRELPFFQKWKPLVRTELTRISPYVYVHKSKMNTFENYGHSLGYFTGSNSENIFIGLEGSPKEGLWVQMYYQKTVRGKVDSATVEMQYNHETLPYLDDPEKLTLTGIKGKWYLTSYLHLAFDIFRKDWERQLYQPGDERPEMEKWDGSLQLIIGL
tara:strand:+ start:2777 stop:4342 length:1566 start_codon:yes stop_codon:yes gene_type:complete